MVPSHTPRARTADAPGLRPSVRLSGPMKNAALAQLDWLVGEWDLTMTDAWFLDSPT